MNVFHFSGGTTSALMVIKYYKQGDLVIFCDTGREHPKTYKFINDFEANEGIPIVRLSYHGGWRAFLSKMKGIPNRAKRRCTIEMKIKTARRWLRSQGIVNYTQYVGFRADEHQRVKNYKQHWKKVRTIFPLYEDGINSEIKNSFWESKEYKLEIPRILSNCDLCFMKGEDKVIAILTNDITLADKWIEDEEDGILNPKGYTYFTNTTMRKLRDTAQDFINKGTVFNLENMTAKFSCSCTS